MNHVRVVRLLEGQRRDDARKVRLHIVKEEREILTANDTRRHQCPRLALWRREERGQHALSGQHGCRREVEDFHIAGRRTLHRIIIADDTSRENTALAVDVSANERNRR
jgi:hypothetical protein